MPNLTTQLPDIIIQQIIHIPAIVKHNTQLELICKCGTLTKLTARSLIRKWATKEEYLCKSCHVKTYVNDEARIEKAKTTYKKHLQDPNHIKKLSNNGKKAWENPETAQKIKNAISASHKNNPKVISARNRAREALRNKSWYKEHLALMRLNQNDTKSSILEDIVSNILTDLNIKHTRQFTLGHTRYDILVQEQPEFIIEVNGDYWHSQSIAKDSAKITYAHNMGYTVHCIWEHEFSNKSSIIDKIKLWCNKTALQTYQFNLKDIIISEIDIKVARIFLGSYHYLPAISKFGYSIGAYLNNTLIATATFSSLTRNQSAERLGLNINQVRELSRFCIHPQYQIKNLASYFLSRCIKILKNKNPKIIKLISFADQDQGHTGTIYRATNWRYDGETKPSYYYISKDNYYAHKKTIWDRAKKMKLTEEAYALANGFIKVSSKPKYRYIYEY